MLNNPNHLPLSGGLRQDLNRQVRTRNVPTVKATYSTTRHFQI